MNRITGGNETTNRDEVRRLSTWCTVNNLNVSTTKTKEVIVDFGKNRPEHQPIYIKGDCVERVSVFRFLGLHLGDELTWKANTTALIKEAQQRLHFLRILKKNNMTEKLLVTFDRCPIESVLTNCIPVWFTCFTAGEKTELQRLINTAQKIKEGGTRPLRASKAKFKILKSQTRWEPVQGAEKRGKVLSLTRVG